MWIAIMKAHAGNKSVSFKSATVLFVLFLWYILKQTYPVNAFKIRKVHVDKHSGMEFDSSLFHNNSFTTALRKKSICMLPTFKVK